MFGDRIKNLRLSLGYTRDGFARLLGVSGPAVTRWEHGDSQPSAKAFVKLAHAAGFSVEEMLYFLEDDSADPVPCVTPETAERIYLTKALEDLGVILPNGTIDKSQLHFMTELVRALKALYRNAAKNNVDFATGEEEVANVSEST